jgi:hypothetical protein
LNAVKIIGGVLCVLMMALTVWLVRNIYIIPAIENTVFFETSASIEQLFLNDATQDEKPTIRVVYFWQNHCPCDQLTKPHFLLMMDQYPQAMQQVDFYMASVDDETLHHDLQGINVLSDQLMNVIKKDIKATPAVGIWNEYGDLVYFGPHSLGYICNNDTSFIKKVLDALLNQQLVSASRILGDGCFCGV